MIGIRLQVHSTCRDEAGAWDGWVDTHRCALQIKSNQTYCRRRPLPLRTVLGRSFRAEGQLDCGASGPSCTAMHAVLMSEVRGAGGGGGGMMCVHRRATAPGHGGAASRRHNEDTHNVSGRRGMRWGVVEMKSSEGGRWKETGCTGSGWKQGPAEAGACKEYTHTAASKAPYTYTAPTPGHAPAHPPPARTTAPPYPPARLRRSPAHLRCSPAHVTCAVPSPSCLCHGPRR